MHGRRRQGVAGDGMAGLMMEHMRHGRVREASRLASETMALVESIGKPDLDGRAVPRDDRHEVSDRRDGRSAALVADRHRAGRRRPVKGNISTGRRWRWRWHTRGTARCALGRAGWRDDFDRALAMTRSADPMSHAAVITYAYGFAIAGGVRLADDAALRDIEEALQIAERSSEDFALGLARFTLGVALVHRDVPGGA